MDLIDEFPLLSSLIEQRKDGQRQLGLGRARDGSGTAPLGSALEVMTPEPPSPPEAPGPEAPLAEAGDPPSQDVLPAPGSEADTTASQASPPAEPPAPQVSAGVGPQHGRGDRRPGRYGLSVQFESREGDPELGRLVESTVWVNEAHPAYRRAVASRSEGYHVALAAALALAALAVEPAKEHAFVSAFLASWGDALTRRRKGRRR